MFKTIFNWLIDYVWGIAVGAVFGLVLAFLNYIGWMDVTFDAFKWTKEQQEAVGKIFDVVGIISLFLSIISASIIAGKRIKTGKWF